MAVKLEADTNLDFQQRIIASRLNVGPSIADFKFNKKRIRMLRDVEDVPDHSKSVVYWMSRDQRVEDNWALLYAQKLALKTELPLHVVFCLQKKFLDATLRHFKFMLAGLQEVEVALKLKNIPFHILQGPPDKVLPKFVVDETVGAVVTDFSPLRISKSWISDLEPKLPKDVAFIQVDAHNIVPLWEASPKQEWAARTIRPKITKQLPEYLTHFPSVIDHPYPPAVKPEKVDWSSLLESLEVDRSVDEVQWASPGTNAGLKVLQEFCEKRIKAYSTQRNDPNKDALSMLSPWFHYGQISVQRAVLCANLYKAKNKEAVEAFCEEAIVRRELSDNFCYYNEKYDSLDGGPDWAKKSLKEHENDKRPHLYTDKEFELGKTYDKLWNAAQLQLVRDGKIHGFMRMYWAKKILEWSKSPERCAQDHHLVERQI
ncbi:Deoxyribodipyrimidine photo-lyase [Halotydeus destructor]|nr:Deoxyribodipyrimidine photo-lyase [Halotydeus destructor]